MTLFLRPPCSLRYFLCLLTLWLVDGRQAAGASTDVTPDAQLLPVIVRVRWEGTAGEREFTQGFWIARM